MHKIANLAGSLMSIAAVLLLASPALCFHKQTPAVLQITASGDNDLPRLPSQGRRAIAVEREALATDEVVMLLPFKTLSQATVLGSGDTTEHPTTSFNGRNFAWSTDTDPLGNGAAGKQIIMNVKGDLLQAAIDPTGTSDNPSFDKRGKAIAFESEGDLAGTGNSGVRQIFLRDKEGSVIQITSGSGSSRHPMLSPKKNHISFESTTDPSTGTDTGVWQIWVGALDTLPVTRITNGLSDSTNAILSDDGRLVAFQSKADLATDGSDTGVDQVFIYDTRTFTYAQITDDPAGCTRPAVAKVRRDYRIAFICSGNAYYYMLREDQQYHVMTTGGSTQGIFPEMGVHFVMVSTTANLLTGGTTAGHQLYVVNLFRTPSTPVAGLSTWFPFRGIAAF